MMIEGIRDREEQPPTGLRHLYGQKKKVARMTVDRARRSMEEEQCRNIDEDGGKKMIFKGALYIIQMLCRRYTFWSYPAGLTISDPP